MTIREYIESKGLMTECQDAETLDTECGDEVHTQEMSDGYRVYIQPGYYIDCQLTEES